MKLIKCHIENFGKLHDFDYTFLPGLNSIKEENGWGKSTFATFIKSMFYGLPSNNKHSLDENERKKFTPWQGGNYGGNITFEINDKQYRIERFFGKNNSEDTFEIIDVMTGKKSKDFKDNVGEEIFGLDEAAFERSLFIPQKILNSNINESISNKLTKLIQGTTEEFNFEQAVKALEKKRSALYNIKGSGEIQKLESKRDEIIAQINELNVEGGTIADIQKRVDNEDEQIQELIAQQDEVKAKIKQYSKLQEKIANRELFEKLNSQLSSTEAEIKQKQKILNGQITSVVEIDSFIEKSKEIDKNENKLKAFENNYVKERYEKLQKYFEKSIPSVEETKEISENIARLNVLSAPKVNEPAEKTGGGKKKICFLLVIWAVLSLVAGVFTIKPNLTLGVVMFVLGVVLLIGAGFIHLVNMINQKTANNHRADFEKLIKNEEEALRLRGKVEEFLSSYENVDGDYASALNNIVANRNEYNNIKKQLEKEESESKELLNIINEYKGEIENFLSKFVVEGGSDYDKLLLIRQTFIDESKLSELLKGQERELEKFKKDKNFDIDEDVEEENINELQRLERDFQNKIDERREEKAKYISTIGKIQDDISILDDLENEKDNISDCISKLTEELNALKNAKNFLESANDSLSSKFLEPMKNGLNKYLKLITSKNFDNLKLDTDFNISFEEYGKLRDVDYYSKGYKNTIDLCMRLALIDALFDKETPFIILDDPFVNLDESKIENAKEFLKELSKTYQLIYFSCHQTRSLSPEA